MRPKHQTARCIMKLMSPGHPGDWEAGSVAGGKRSRPGFGGLSLSPSSTMGCLTVAGKCVLRNAGPSFFK